MSQFLILSDIDQPKVASIKYDEKSALTSVAVRNEGGLANCIAKEFAYKPEPKDVEVSWVVYYTINGTEFSEVFKTRKLARMEKKYLQEHGLYLGDVEDIYIQREEVWVVDKKKVN